jgi:plasmid stabilization system protein ParE
MAYRIFWTPIAVQDLRGVCDFISQDNLAAAQRFGEELIKQVEVMGLFPQSGRMVPEKNAPLSAKPSSVRTASFTGLTTLTRSSRSLAFGTVLVPQVSDECAVLGNSGLHLFSTDVQRAP